jgi:TatD DNase family protein
MKKFEHLIQKGELFDSHCHLASLENKNEAIHNARLAGVTSVIEMAIDMPTSIESLESALKYDGVVYATAGLHPEFLVPNTDVAGQTPWDTNKIVQEIENLQKFIEVNIENVTMLGECGIDWYWLNKLGLDNSELKNFKSKQIELFEAQVELSIKYDLPLSIHVRDSFEDALEIINRLSPKTKGVFHSFTGSLDEVKKIIDLGFYIGINGIITYKSADSIREVVKYIMGKRAEVTPSDFYDKQILFETDAPYLKPSNSTSKNKFNEPMNIASVFEYTRKLIT